MPSNEDLEVTKKINDGANLLGIDLLDHVIIGNNRYISMKELDMF